MSTTKGLALVNESAVMLNDERIALLRKTVANDAPPLEFEMFVGVCNRTGLDPFAKQIYFIKRGSKWSTQTGIDGYRLIAQRTGEYAGSDEAIYDTEDANYPGKATVTVWRIVNGVRCPFTASARWKEYAQVFNGKLGDTWERFPYLMLAKCAESLALRKAFPQELSGLYTREEMDQAGPVENGPYVEAAGRVVERVTGEIIDSEDLPHSASEWQTIISMASTLEDLDSIKADMATAGFSEESHPNLLSVWRKAHNALRLAEAKKVDAA